MAYNLDEKFDIILQDVQFLKDNDVVFKKILAPELIIKRERGNADIAALVRIVIGQQISNKVANTLWQKLTNDINPNDADDLLNANDDQLRSYGLSRQKITYVRGLAQSVKDKAINIESWINADDDTVKNEITALKGFGPWSAQIFMMFHLCHRHIWPAGDLGLQLGLQIYMDEETKPTEKEARNKQILFKGRETAAAFLLWELKGDSLP